MILKNRFKKDNSPRRFISWVFIFGVFSALYAENSIEFNSNCTAAYKAIYALQNNTADSLIELEIKKNNATAWYLKTVRYGIESYVQDNISQIKKHQIEKAEILENLKSSPQNSPLHRFYLAEANLHWAILEIKLGNYFSAFLHVRKSHVYIKENQKLFPDFYLNKKISATIEALAGSIPSKYKWGAELVGISGSLPEALNTLENLQLTCIQKNNVYADEVTSILALIKLHLNKEPEAAWKAIKTINTAKNNTVFTGVKAAIGLYSGHSAEVESEVVNQNFVAFPILSFYVASAKLNMLNTDAENYFDYFLVHTSSKNHIKTAYLKKAWCALLRGNSDLYFFLLEKVKTQGATELDVDKQALSEASENNTPAITLLKARLLCDGGNYTKALETIKTVPEKEKNTHATEYVYRFGRIYHLLKDQDKAILFYEKTIQETNAQNYYPASAALYLGNIYEENGNKTKAAFYYKKCIELNKLFYRSGIEQRAKARLNVLK